MGSISGLVSVCSGTTAPGGRLMNRSAGLATLAKIPAVELGRQSGSDGENDQFAKHES